MPTQSRNGGLTMTRLATLISFLPLLFAACTRPPVAIGFVGPLTGSSSAIGLGCRNGFLLALGAGLGAAPGSTPSLHLIVKDDKNDADTCLKAFQELKAQGCSIVVLGTPSQAATKAVPWAVANGILVITPTVSSHVEGDDSALFIRVNMPSADYGEVLARAAFERFHATKVGLIGDSRNSGYVQAVSAAFNAEYVHLGGKTSFDLTFDSSKDNPAAGLADRIRSTGCDGLFVITASSEAVVIAKELERARLHIQIFFPPWPLTPDLIQNGGAAVEGAVALSIADLEFRSPAGKAFENAYRTVYGEAPGFTAMFGWESAAILRKALAGPGPTAAVSIRDRIIAIGHFDGLQGPIDFNAKGSATRAMFLFRIENGAFRRLD
ncbi:MAG: ABC transporter substrate-binding protein [Treponema sp.]|nr:ABC transporter substrate-binding protein [Treponema sp.]